MAPMVLAASPVQRLADQLQTLSELTESLTYRLLELEEKVAALDLRLEPVLERAAAAAPVLADDTELRLDDTEERLARLETMLSGLAELPRSGEADPHFPDEDVEQNFLDEQPFLEAQESLDEEADAEHPDERLSA
jgi:hypothetical protein